MKDTQDIARWIERLDILVLAGILTNDDIAAILLVRLGGMICSNEPKFMISYIRSEIGRYSGVNARTVSIREVALMFARHVCRSKGL